tara:strand:- start:3 stop:434 length:432 start_codon:yes stop_codon:yes gene_type:complete
VGQLPQAVVVAEVVVVKFLMLKKVSLLVITLLRRTLSTEFRLAAVVAVCRDGVSPIRVVAVLLVMAIPVVLKTLPMYGTAAVEEAAVALEVRVMETNALLLEPELPRTFQVTTNHLGQVAVAGHSKMGVTVRLGKLLLLTRSA